MDETEAVELPQDWLEPFETAGDAAPAGCPDGRRPVYVWTRAEEVKRACR